MFGKRRPQDPGVDAPDPAAQRRAVEALERARSERASSPARKTEAGAAERPRQARAYAAPPGPRPRVDLPGTRTVGDGRRLVVGRDISLSGEIKACETLIVEGEVSADLKDCRVLQISASGRYQGAAEVDRAEISGRFDGDLTVNETLTLRATGRVQGRLRYRDMEIERGGTVNGTMEELPAPGEAAEDRPKRTGKARSRASVARAKGLLARSTASEPTTA